MLGESVGNYEILELLGSSEPGSLYKARRRDSGELVALRFLPEELRRDDGRTRRFLEDARSSASLSDHIDPIEALEEAPDGRLFYCTKYRPGETVQRRLDRGPLTLDESIRIALEVCEGLSSIHSEGLVHGGVRPDNVLVGDDSEVILQGFGLDPLGQEADGSRLGEISYFSTEQVEGEAPGPAADIWGVGVLLFEMVTGRRPFRGESPTDVSRSILSSDPPTLSAFRAGIPPQLEDVVRRALEKDPAERPTDLEAMRRDLLKVREHLSDRTQVLSDGKATPRVTVSTEPSSMLGRSVGPFLVEEKLGGGGMGIVYRARDERLDRPVALKFLPSDLGGAEEEKQRFIQEARAASALDHPNICTIYQIDEVPDGPVFIAMACYEGKTLKQKIEQGPLSLAEAVRLTLQTAQGLAAAHERGIVHRDIKPANVIVTNDGIVKILDFGLSKVQAAPSDLTRTGTILGTASYMSPEQARGEAMDGRTDVWSLGVVLYELLTGRKPFTGPNELAVLHAIVSRDPAPPSELREGLPPEVDEVVCRCLEKDVDARTASMADLIRGLAALDEAPTSSFEAAGVPVAVRGVDETTRLESPSVARSGWRSPAEGIGPEDPTVVSESGIPVGARRRWGVVLAILVALLAASAAVRWLGLGGSDEPVDVAFAGLEWRGAEARHAGVALALEELVRLELERVDTLRGVALPPRPPGSESSWAEILAGDGPIPATGEDRRVVAGSVDVAEDLVTVELALADLSDGVREARSVEGRLDELTLLAERAVAEMGHAWGRRVPDGPEASAAGALPLPADADALRLLEEGRDELSRLDAPAAGGALERAREHEPDNPMILASLADASEQLGRLDEAEELRRRAAEEATDLPLLQRALLRAFAVTEEHPRVSAALFDVVAAESELDLFTTLDRVESLILAGRSDEAATLLGDLEEGSPEDPRILQLEAWSAERVGERKVQLEKARQAAEGASDRGWDLLRGVALLREGNAEIALGRLDEARQSLEEADRIFSGRRYDRGRAWVLNELGRVAHEARRTVDAYRYWDEAAVLYDAYGDTTKSARILSNKALLLEQDGELERSAEVYREVVRKLEAGDDPIALAATLGNLSLPLIQLGELEEAGEVLEKARSIRFEHTLYRTWLALKHAGYLVLVGDLGEARRAVDEATKLANSVRDRIRLLEADLVSARIATIEGRLDEAGRRAETALATARELKEEKWVLRAARELGEIRLLEADWEASRALLEESLEIHRSIDEKRDSDDPRISLARLELEAGSPARALELLNGVVADLERSGSVLGQALAGPLLGEALWRRGRREEAAAAVRSALEASSAWEAPAVDVPLQARSARVLAGLGELEEAREVAEGLRQRLGAAAGRVLWDLEMRLADLEVEVASGTGASTLERDLERQAERADQAGFHALSRRARSLLDRVRG